MNNKILFDSYIMYGLNRRRSFLHLPKGNKVRLSSAEEIEEFSKEVLKEKDCNCALFYVYLDGTSSAFFKSFTSQELVPSEFNEYEKELVESYAICRSERKRNMHLFAELDGNFRFCCYSLLIEKKDGVFEVCK